VSSKKTLKEFITEIRIPLESGDYDSALKILLDAIKVYPDESSLVINIGNIYRHKGKLRTAENYYKKSLEIKESKEAHNNLSVLYLDDNVPELSITHSVKAIEIDADYVDARYNAALALERIGKYEDAIIHLNFILKVNKNNEKAISYTF